MAQTSTLTLDHYERRYYTTTDTIETVLADEYFNPFKRELEINEIVNIVIGSNRHKVIITQLDTYVTSEKFEDADIRQDITDLQQSTGILPSPPGDSIAPIIGSFTATMAIDTLVADLIMTATDNVGITGWIVKVDDTTLPASGDAEWETAEPSTKTVPDINPHTLTLRVRDAALNVSSPVTITVTPTTTTTLAIATLSTINPA